MNSTVPLAIIGMACRFPKADNLTEYWGLIQKGGSAITELPSERFNAEMYFHPERGVVGKSYTKLGGVVPEREFNRAACPISDELLAGADPVHLALLEVVAAACQHAEFNPFDLPLRNTGVFIGHSRGSLLGSELIYSTRIEEVVGLFGGMERFSRLPPDLREGIIFDLVNRIHRNKPRRHAGKNPHLTPNAVAGLIAEALSLNGPYMAIEAACASAMYALALAELALLHGRVDMAIVGGASYTSWHSLVLFSQAQALSAVGSFPFDSRADGFVSADGYAAIILKTLPKALADGDPIQGVIRGIGVSSDGRGKSLWAPRKEGQIEAFRRAYARSGLSPGRLQYIEAHSTSTQLGDATEVESIATALGDCLGADQKIPIASVKANIGHTCETAGLAGLIKTVLAMQHRIVPRAINYRSPNPQIDWNGLPLFVPIEELPWLSPGSGEPRCAGVNAFGIGGLNVHVVLSEGVARGEQHSRTVPAPKSAEDNGKVASPGDDDAVAIIGLGAIFPGALSVEAYWNLLTSGRDPKSKVPKERWDPAVFFEADAKGPWRSPSRLGAFIEGFDYDWQKHKIPPKQLETADLLQFMLLNAADQAMRDAGYESKTFDRSRVAVMIGTIFVGDFVSNLSLALHLAEFEGEFRSTLGERGLAEQQTKEIVHEFRDLFLRANQSLRDETASFSSSTLASRISKALDLMGGAFALDAGEASSMAAVSVAVDMLLAGTCDIVVCGAGQRAMSVDFYEDYGSRGWLSSSDNPKPPFDASANGFVLGEGAGAVVLKRLSAARRDGDPIRAIIRGVGAATDTRSLDAAFKMAFDRGLRTSRVNPRDITMIETAGTGVPEFDAQEICAVAETYAAESRDRPLMLGSTVGQLGHSRAAAGMASLLKVALAFQHLKMPANFSLGVPAESITKHIRSISLSTEQKDLDANPEGTRRFVGVNNFAFRGLAYHALLEDGNFEASRGETEQEFRIVRMGAPSLAQLTDRLRRNSFDAAVLWEGAGLSDFAATDRARIALAVESETTLTAKLKLAQEQLTEAPDRPALEEQGIFFNEIKHEPPRIAFLFPGQGSQYEGMLAGLTRFSPAAAAKLQEIDQTMKRLGYPAFAEIAWTSKHNLGEDVWITQISLLLSETILYSALTALGVRPDIISAHSYGEYAGLVACGAWSLEQAILVTAARCKLIVASERARGQMLVTTAPPLVVERLATDIQGTACVANHNAPDQTVIGGDNQAIAEIASRLQREGFETRVLAVPCPFHTPLMVDLQKPLEQVLAGERILPPRIPFLSSVTNRYVADPVEIRRNLAVQFTEPVRYVDLVERLASDGVSVFIEVGPRQVLSRLNRRILAGRDVTIVASDNPKKGGIEQLVRVQAALESAGVSFGQLRAQPEQRAAGVSIAVKPDYSKRRIVHFDATLRRKKKLSQPAASTRESTVSPPRTANGEAGGEIASFLIQFVCEQTGYPADVVTLDADLEADLGIDSIKKAQLFGELREHFDLKIDSASGLSVDDYPTLRHVLEFLKSVGASKRQELAVPSGRDGNFTTPSTANMAEIRVSGEAPVASAAALITVGLNLVRCAGSPYEMGLQHGQVEAARIGKLLRPYENVSAELREWPDIRDAISSADRYFTKQGVEEIQGIADALGRPVEDVIALNLGIVAFNLGIAQEMGLSPEDVAGCTQFAVTASLNGEEGLLHGVNEDWPSSLGNKDSLSRIVQVRHPNGGVPHLAFGLSGQVGTLNGINANGVAVSSTLLLDRHEQRPSHVGHFHTTIVRMILESATNVESALDCVRRAERIGAWSLCISDHNADSLCYVEYDGPSLLIQAEQRVVMTTNHSLLHTALVEVQHHSRCRLTRLKNLLQRRNEGGSITVDDAKAALRDSYDLERQRETTHPTMNTIKRVDNQISIVMRPQKGELWVTPGPLAREGADCFHRVSLNEVFADSPLAASQPRVQTVAADVGSAAIKRSGEAGVASDKHRQMMSRFVLRTKHSPLPDNTPKVPRLHGPAIIYGENSTAQALRDRLEKLGTLALMIPCSADIAEAVSAIDRIWTKHRAPHLFLVSGRDPEAACRLGDENWWDRRRACGLRQPYVMCQHWLRLISQGGLLKQATLVAATAMGGDFGLSGQFGAVEGGGLAGLLKGIRREFPGLFVKIIDVPIEENPARVAAEICTELSASAGDVEVGLLRGRRQVIRAVPRAAHALRREIPSGGTWVITGGARGITSIVARELGRRWNLSLHLIGSSPAPCIEDAWRDLPDDAVKRLKLSISQKARQAGQDPGAAWRKVEKAIEMDKTLRGFTENGVRATYHCCDVSRYGNLEQVLKRVRQADGPIHGIIHGAGFELASRFDRKQLANVEATIAAKVDGAVALMSLTREDPLSYFLAFGSVIGRFGGLGQTDYSLASDMLAKLIHWFRMERPECASCVFEWPAWDEVGMCVRPETRIALEVDKQSFMSPAEGVDHVIEELRAGVPEGEVLILDQPRTLDLDGILPNSELRGVYLRLDKVVRGLPLTAGVLELKEGEKIIIEARLDPVTDPFLLQHQFRGRPMLPSVIGIEALAEAAYVLTHGQPVVGLADVVIANGFRFHSDRSQLAKVRAFRTERGLDCELTGDFINRNGQLVEADKLYITGRVETSALRESLVAPRPSEHTGAEWHDMQYPDPSRARKEGIVLHGPMLRCLRQISLHPGGGVGRILAPEIAEVGGQRGTGWIVPAAVLDSCLVACAVFANKALQVNQLPISFDSLLLGRLPASGELCMVHFAFKEHSDRRTCFDFTVFGSDDSVLLVVTGHRSVCASRKDVTV